MLRALGWSFGEPAGGLDAIAVGQAEGMEGQAAAPRGMC